jgi:hypothetical protein
MKRFIVFCILFLTPIPVSAQANSLWLGVVRTDKTIVPFAMYDGSSWSNPWPKGYHIGYSSPDTTITSFDRIPKKWHAPLPVLPREWYAHDRKGTFSTVAVTRPVITFSWCEMYWSLLIGNAEIPVDRHKTVLIEGFAASPNIQSDPVPPVEKDSEEWSRIIGFILPALEKAEDESSNPLSSSERKKVDLKIIRLNRSIPGSDGIAMYRFEIERDYGKANLLPSRSEFSRSQFTGWISAEKMGTLKFIVNRFHHESNTYEISNERITPLGTITIDGQTLWVVMNRYYEGESYSVLEVTPSGVRTVIDTYGGGC